MESASPARRFYGENVSRFFEASEQVHTRHGVRDTGDGRHDTHRHRARRRLGGQAPQRGEPPQQKPPGGGTRTGPAGRRDGRREAVRRQEHAGHRRPDGRLQAALLQDGAPHARQGREQVHEGQRRQDAGLPRGNEGQTSLPQ